MQEPIQQVVVRWPAGSGLSRFYELHHQNVQVFQNPRRPPLLETGPHAVDPRNQGEGAEVHFRLIAGRAPVKGVLYQLAVRREHGARDDIERQFLHGAFEVERAAGPVLVPCAQHGVGRLGHDAGVARDALGVEGGRHDAAVPTPGVALDGDEAVPERRRQQRADDPGLDVVRGVVLQDTLHALRMAHQEVVKPEEFPLGDVFLEVGGIEAADQAVAHGPSVGDDGPSPLRHARKHQCRPLVGPGVACLHRCVHGYFKMTPPDRGRA